MAALPPARTAVSRSDDLERRVGAQPGERAPPDLPLRRCEIPRSARLGELTGEAVIALKKRDRTGILAFGIVSRARGRRAMGAHGASAIWSWRTTSRSSAWISRRRCERMGHRGRRARRATAGAPSSWRASCGRTWSSWTSRCRRWTASTPRRLIAREKDRARAAAHRLQPAGPGAAGRRRRRLRLRGQAVHGGRAAARDRAWPSPASTSTTPSRQQAADLQEALETRKVVDRAKGILMDAARAAMSRRRSAASSSRA